MIAAHLYAVAFRAFGTAKRVSKMISLVRSWRYGCFHFDYFCCSFWFASAGFSCDSRSIQNRMVFGIRLFSVTDCAGHTKPETVLQEQPVERVTLFRRKC